MRKWSSNCKFSPGVQKQMSTRSGFMNVKLNPQNHFDRSDTGTVDLALGQGDGLHNS